MQLLLLTFVLCTLLIYLILTLLKCLAYTLYVINKKIKVEMEMKRIYVKPHVEQHSVLIEKLLTEASDQGDHAESKPHDNTLWEQDEEWTNKFENKSKRGKNIK